MEWLDRYAEALGLDPLTAEDREVLLALARDVAHGTERPNAPLATYLAARSVAMRLMQGADAADALREAAAAAHSLLPDHAEPRH